MALAIPLEKAPISISVNPSISTTLQLTFDNHLHSRKYFRLFNKKHKNIHKTTTIKNLPPNSKNHPGQLQLQLLRNHPNHDPNRKTIQISK